ncbi:natural resistance-associated macrophage protein [Pholiota conissans]|uniref:Natural resistance-associated macrophage protein n=1 Tax=Pholiota conissans TaxID=109636 RepID=A0A9P5YJN4_9AGAR|nr:natural resistance-associated macrophage protein [Pholiota conissans]
MNPAEHVQPAPYLVIARRKLKKTARTVAHHLKRHVGVGIICSVAYFDPGNWSVDLQAGSSFGYRPMLFVILMAGLGAVVLQTLAARLGCVTGLDLASHCRLLLHDHPRHPKLVRRCVLYPLYVLSEIAIISTDLAELLGSAIGFCLLFPKLPLWAGVVLTAADVLIFLSFSDPSRSNGRPVRLFEYTIIGLVFAVFGCFIALLVKAGPVWSQVFIGFLPDKGLFQSDPDAVYAAVGILGATVMPHALFLGSSLATQDRVSDAPPEENLPSPQGNLNGVSFTTKLRQFIRPLFRITRANRAESTIDYRSKYGERSNNSYSFIRAHLSHGVTDVVTSLLALAVPINSAILILSAAVFFQEKEKSEMRITPAGLFDAHALIKSNLGEGAALTFALALVCAGQTSSITVTLAGQIVAEGFIEWKVSPFFRRLITRCISLVPSVIVAVAVGQRGIDSLLVGSQVVLSIVLPFVAFPLIYLTSRDVVMRVRKPPTELVEIIKSTQSQDGEVIPGMEEVKGVVAMEQANALQSHGHAHANDEQLEILEFEEVAILPTDKTKVEPAQVVQVTNSSEETIDYSNGRWFASLSYVIWCIVLIANAYAIVMLFLGEGVA